MDTCGLELGNLLFAVGSIWATVLGVFAFNVINGW